MSSPPTPVFGPDTRGVRDLAHRLHENLGLRYAPPVATLRSPSGAKRHNAAKLVAPRIAESRSLPLLGPSEVAECIHEWSGGSEVSRRATRGNWSRIYRWRPGWGDGVRTRHHACCVPRFKISQTILPSWPSRSVPAVPGRAKVSFSGSRPNKCSSVA